MTKRVSSSTRQRIARDSIMVTGGPEILTLVALWAGANSSIPASPPFQKEEDNI